MSLAAAPPVDFIPLAPTARRSGAPWALAIVVGITIVGSATLGLDYFLTAVAVILQTLFFVFAARHVCFALSAVRSVPRDLAAPIIDTGYQPTVSVLVPCKNEEPVVDGLLASLFALDYPRDLIEFVLVDDGSLDATGEILDRRALTEENLVVVHRPAGDNGGKSGALNAGLQVAKGEITVIFDADHKPRPDVVRRLVRHFADPQVGAVQGRCVIRNPGDAPLTHLIAIDYLAGYLVNEYGRQSLFQLPAYGGANCAARTSSIRALGGWNPDSVTEDTDLTMRLVLAGQAVRYDVSAVDEEEGVVTFTRYWRQRYRWARGHQQVWRDYRQAVVRSPHLSFLRKLETIMFLLVFHMPVFSALGLTLLLVWSFGVPHSIDPLHAFQFWTLLFVGPLVELASGLLIAHADRRDALQIVLFLPLFFVFVAICTRAWIDGLIGRRYVWVKTQRSDRGPGAVAVS